MHVCCPDFPALRYTTVSRAEQGEITGSGLDAAPVSAGMGEVQRGRQ